MFKRISLSLLFCAIGGLIASLGYQRWREDPVRHYRPAECTIIDHQIALDEKRWKANNRDALRVDTQAVLSSGNRRELIVHEFFSSDDDAWKFINTNPGGTEKRYLISEGGDVAVWNDYTPSLPMVAIVAGSLVLLCSLAWFFYFHRIRIRDAWLAALAGGFFLIMGLYVAGHLWSSAITHVQAAQWESTPYTSLGHRILISGGGGKSGASRTHQEAIQYDFRGKTYVSIRPGKNSHPAHDRVCRVNSDHPWQVALSWGWRPVLAHVLAPIPVLTIGSFVLLMTFSSSFQKLTKDTQRTRSRERNRPLKKTPMAPWESGFLLLFIGPIVGIFAFFCGEMWWDGDSAKWVMTILLIPFVIWILFLVKSFVRELRRMPSEKSRS